MENQEIATPSQEETREQPSTRDVIAQTYAEIEARQNESESDLKKTSDRVRDEQGRFAKKEIETPETASVEQSLPIEEKTEASKPVEAPQGWSAAAKAKFAALDPEVQAEIVKRESDIHKALTKQDDERQIGKRMRDVITSYTPVIQNLGGDPAKVFMDGLQALHTLQHGNPQQKAAVVQAIIQGYGVDLGTAQPQQEYVDPQYTQLQNEVVQIKNLLAQQQQAQQQNTFLSTAEELKAFAADPKYAHFEKLKPDMATLLQTGQAKGLQEAYEKAMWMHPEVRSTLVAQQAEQRAKEEKAKLEAKRKAGVSVTGSPGAGVPSNPQRKFENSRDQISAIYDDVMGGRL